MSAESVSGVRDAIILAAGNGDRFRNPNPRSKLLHPVLGQPLIHRTLRSAVAAGITRLHVVTGFDAATVREAIVLADLPGVSVDFAHNPDWHLENGVSALAAESLCGDRPFALLMGDHLVEPVVLQRLIRHHAQHQQSVLAIDNRPADAAVVAEATRVRLDGTHIVAIGKEITPWDALDTGVFVFTPVLFDALREAQAGGRTTLSAGVQRLAEKRLMRGAPVVDCAWCDIDTPEDLGLAESMLAEHRTVHA